MMLFRAIETSFSYSSGRFFHNHCVSVAVVSCCKFLVINLLDGLERTYHNACPIARGWHNCHCHLLLLRMRRAVCQREVCRRTVAPA